ncbi:Glutathione S-transferase theta-1 [Chamberlinius hualienensis]
MVLKCYYDLMSQPSRALYIFLKINKIPFESCPVALRKGAHLAEDYAKINRFQKVPAIDHDGFKLAESVAIFQYLSRELGDAIGPNWYPKDPKLAARVDEFNSWQQHNLRAHGSLYFMTKFIEPTLFGKPVNEGKLAKHAENLEATLDKVEKYFLNNQKFLCGDQITVADLLGSCEVEQPRAVGYDVYKNRPILKAWVERVKQATQPIYDEAHQFNYVLLEKYSKL